MANSTYGNTPGIAAPNPSGIPGFNLDYVQAHSGGGATSATPLPGWCNVVTVVAADHDSVALPPGYPSEPCVVINNGAHILTVYGSNSDTIAVATSTSQVTTGITIASGAIQVFVCISGEYGNTNAPVGAQWKALKG